MVLVDVNGKIHDFGHHCVQLINFHMFINQLNTQVNGYLLVILFSNQNYLFTFLDIDQITNEHNSYNFLYGLTFFCLYGEADFLVKFFF